MLPLKGFLAQNYFLVITFIYLYHSIIKLIDSIRNPFSLYFNIKFRQSFSYLKNIKRLIFRKIKHEFLQIFYRITMCNTFNKKVEI
jgi:hypothetical protein